MKTGLDYVIFQNFQAEQSVNNDNNDIDHNNSSYHLLNDRFYSW